MRRYGLLLIMSLLLVVVIQAQTEADWEVPLYTTEGIQVVTAEGIEYIIPLPEAQPKYIFGTSGYKSSLLSPDYRYLVKGGNPDYDSAHSESKIYITDLEAGTCCIEVESPIGDGFTFLTLGVFNPEITQFTAAVTTSGETEEDRVDLMLVIDVQTGMILRQLDPKRLFNGAREVIFISWDAEGVRLVPIGDSGLGWREDTFAYIWDIDTDEVRRDETYYGGLEGEYLSATGEYLRYNNRPRFATSGNVSPYNSIELITSNDVVNVREILRYPDDGPAITPHWVLDGTGYLLMPAGNDYKLIMRDGRIIDIPRVGNNARFIAGTPDGWIIGTRETGTDRLLPSGLYHITMPDERIVVTEIAPYDGGVPLRVPDMGTRAIGVDMMRTELDLNGAP
ncbi:MAG: hypothetical protein CL607_11460 [Anaerolineaceae bacterium]|nr:hypothetical protein [Anaerolineaceae bacterium]